MTRSIPYPVMNSASRLLALVVGVLTLSAALPALEGIDLAPPGVVYRFEQ